MVYYFIANVAISNSAEFVNGHTANNYQVPKVAINV